MPILRTCLPSAAAWAKMVKGYQGALPRSPTLILLPETETGEAVGEPHSRPVLSPFGLTLQKCRMNHRKTPICSANDETGLVRRKFELVAAVSYLHQALTLACCKSIRDAMCGQSVMRGGSGSSAIAASASFDELASSGNGVGTISRQIIAQALVSGSGDAQSHAELELVRQKMRQFTTPDGKLFQYKQFLKTNLKN